MQELGYKKDYNKTKAPLSITAFENKNELIIEITQALLPPTQTLKMVGLAISKKPFFFSIALTVTGFLANHFWSIPVKIDKPLLAP